MPPSRVPYTGPRRRLVLAFDIGTTFSGVSYSILDPGQVPQILGIRRFPGQENNASDSKIPSILYYGKDGNVKAVGAEALLPHIRDEAEDNNWIKVEWFKLHLRPQAEVDASRADVERLKVVSALPPTKAIIDVYSDFMKYLFECARTYITETHASGDLLWASIQQHIDFVLSHPNGWGGHQQSKMREAAAKAGLVSQAASPQIRFVTEGEASVHFCISNGLATEAMQNGQNVMVVDAGGGTVDINTYSIVAGKRVTMEEIAASECLYHGSAIVTSRAHGFLKRKLANSRFGNAQDIDEMRNQFDKTTKLVFRSADDMAYIKFGSMRDRDPSVGIRNGQLTLSGADVASMFEPSIIAIKEVVRRQLDGADSSVSTVFLVGGFAASPWLFSQLKIYVENLYVKFARPDTHTNKAVAEGAVSFYLDGFVTSRVARFTYGARCNIQYNPSDPEHLRRLNKVFIGKAGEPRVPDNFLIILNKGTRVSEKKEFSQNLVFDARNPLELGKVQTDIICYRGNSRNPRWLDVDPDTYSVLCRVVGDTSHVPHLPVDGPAGVFYRQSFRVILAFGLTELKAYLSWDEDGVEKRCQAVPVYDGVDAVA
ncbi:uncharacterized protein LAESUDRAFT_688021 [Laetiporus sulphureus 93-53]|uniref:Actin-like ATPase domain-containing protein n=1 Tax=Laetiporus sulphureus 93-53 TaxID=1314785 RepID=A0A165B9B8_9APHY|nr:uncharacterized protein LAESUDRAFT_688021 [Laetiporus sulphureus 93-53]KZT00544.1 hypothetical protein LAESUDRAFT_688021 [Laetiporus sulphureus 93-53]